MPGRAVFKRAMHHDKIASTHPSKPRQIKSLTGIRGVAAAWVVLFHIQFIGAVNGFQIILPGYRLINSGWTGVDLFFMLSGFMLMHTHANQFDRIDRDGLWSFAISRFFRIYPLNAIVLLLIALLLLSYPGFSSNFRNLSTGNLSISSFLSTLFLATRWFPCQGNWNEPVWSLSAEILGYAAFPFLALMIGKISSFRGAAYVSIITIVSVLIAQFAKGRLGDNDIDWPGALIRMAGYFSAGVALRRAAELWTPQASQLTMGAISLIASATLAVLTLLPAGGGIMPLAEAVLIFSLYFECGIINRLLSSQPAMFLGKISFPLYLLHVMPILAANYFSRIHKVTDLVYHAIIIITLAAVIAISWILHRLVERRAHSFSQTFGRPLYSSVGIART